MPLERFGSVSPPQAQLTVAHETVAFLLAMRAFNQSSIDIDLAHPRNMFSPSTGNAETNVVGAGGRRAPVAYSPPRERYGGGDRPKTGYRKEHPCNPNDVYCVTEEWAFY